MSAQIKDGGPAFPVFPETSTGHASAFRGMTLRDYFAAKAMQGDWAAQDDVANGLFTDTLSNAVLRACADRYYRMADAMLAAREAQS